MQNTPARFNADGRRLYEASGCAGKIAVLAVRRILIQSQIEARYFT